MSEHDIVLGENPFAVDPATPPVPWTVVQTVVGLLLFWGAMFGVALLAGLLRDKQAALSIYFIIYQPLQALPVIAILLWRKATWADIGFAKASRNVLAVGCSLVIGMFVINIVNNLIMVALGVSVQAQTFTGLLKNLQSPAILMLTGIVFAPLFEELVFRGFVFRGLRERLGWKLAAVLSAALFSITHLDFAALVPTFVIGLVFAYLVQKSNSIWPGIILHTLINSFSLCALVLLSNVPGVL